MRNIICKKNGCNKNGLWFYTIAFIFGLIFIVDEGDGKSQGFADYNWKFCGFVV